MYKKQMGIAAGLLALPLVLTAVHDAHAAGKDLVVVHYRLPASAFAMESADTYVLMRAGCLETLARYDDKGRLTPWLAESWTRSGDDTWEFTLRPNVRFQDGTSLDAKAVVGSLQHVLNATTPPRGFTPKEIASVEATGPMTVRITTTAASELLPYRLAGPSTGILSPAAYSPEGIDITGTCTGPYTIVEEIEKQALRLARNEDYWDGTPPLDTVEFRFIADGGARVAQLRSGEADIVMGIPAANVPTLKDDPAFDIRFTTLPRTTKLILNNARAPFDDVRVRQALQHAINLDEIAIGVYEGFATPAVGPFGPGQPWTPEGAEPVAYKPEAAEALLKEAGFDFSKPIELMAYTDRAELPTIGAVIQAQLKRIGVEVAVNVANWPAIEPNFRAGTYDTGLMSRSSVTDMSDPSGYLTADYSCEGSYNLAQFCDPKIDAAIREAGTVEDEAERARRYAEIAEELQSRAVSIYLVHEQQIDGLSSRVQDFALDQMGYYLVTADLDID